MRLFNSRRYQFLAVVVIFHSGGLRASAEGAATAEDVNRLADSATQIVTAFMQESFHLRMGYEYYDRFETDGDRETLLKLASKAADDLHRTAGRQRELKKRIEDYEGDDWEERFGSTGLWRKVAAELYRTELAICEVRYYHALACEQRGRNELLEQIISHIDSLEQSHHSSAAELIEAKALSLLARGDAAYHDSALAKLDRFALYNDVVRPVTAQIERIKLTEEVTSEQMESLLGVLGQNRRAGDIELIVSVMLLQRKYDANGFAQSCRKFAEAQEIIGNLILSDIQSREAGQDLENISATDAELAAVAALTAGAAKYKESLERLLSFARFRNAAVVYVAAAAVAESDPAKAVNLLIEASRLQEKEPSMVLSSSAVEIAETSLEFARSRPCCDKELIKISCKAYENYMELVGGQCDDRIYFEYALLLQDAGRLEEATLQFQQLAEKEDSPFGVAAAAELIISITPSDRDTAEKLLEKLMVLLSAEWPEELDDFRLLAKRHYCSEKLLLFGRDNVADVLELLEETSTENDLYLIGAKARALGILNRLPEALGTLLEAEAKEDKCQIRHTVTEVLRSIAERSDEHQDDQNFPLLIRDALEVAERYVGCFEQDGKNDIMLCMAELYTFTDANNLPKAAELFSQLPPIQYNQYIRCKARLTAAQGDFDGAGRLWAELADMHRVPSGPDERSWQWWRAKYYELWCLSRSEDFARADICHLIEVLENSYSAIPDLWAKKLAALKKQCATP